MEPLFWALLVVPELPYEFPEPAGLDCSPEGLFSLTGAAVVPEAPPWAVTVTVEVVVTLTLEGIGQVPLRVTVDVDCDVTVTREREHSLDEVTVALLRLVAMLEVEVMTPV